jgi:hypothetical protein
LTVGHRLQAREIYPRLRELSHVASSLEPALATRLEEVRRWIKDVKPGSLTQKKFLMGFLLELIKDTEFWLELKAINDEQRHLFFNQLAPTVKYWYEHLFPKWFKERDLKFYIWKQKLRAGEFHQKDGLLIESIAREIKSRSGTVVVRYVADFSMATDVIVSSNTGKPLCVQVTSMADELSHQKYEYWKHTLQGWDIERGIFVSYNPAQDEFVIQLVNLVLHNSNHLPEAKYLKFSF